MEKLSHKMQQEEELFLHQIQALLIHTFLEIFEGDFLPPLCMVESILGYEFKNKCLLKEAFTDSSYDPESCSSYERLEYIGDAVLNLLVSKHLFLLYPNLTPGQLTLLRSTNVDTEKLARVAIKHNLHRFFRHKKPHCRLGDQIEEFVKGFSEYPLHSNGLLDAPKCLADIMEAIIGAVFVDCDSSLDEVWKVFKSLLEPMMDPQAIRIDPISELNQICQKKNLKLQFEDMWEDSTRFNTLIEGKPVGTGTYHGGKKVAQKRAAKNALDNFERVLGISKSIHEEKKEEALVLDLDSPPKQKEKEISSDSQLLLEGVESILGYEFKNKCLLKEAFTHVDKYSSCERLEYIGDAVLNLLIARHHYFSYPNLKPGQMTQLRAVNVARENLARVAIELQLHLFMRHKKPLLGEQIEAFTNAISKYPSYSNGLINAPQSLSDIVKSTVGAVFIDGNSIEKVWKIFRRLLKPIISEPETTENHPKAELHQICQKKNLNIKFVDLWEEFKRFDVFINEKLLGIGIDDTKKYVAENKAAKNALDNISKMLNMNECLDENVLQINVFI